MKIVYTNDEINDSFIYDVLRIDDEVYSKQNCGTFESVSNRFYANKESYVLLYEEHKLLGYACYFPITAELTDQIQNGENFLDDNISPKSICSFDKQTPTDIFLISVAIGKQFQSKGLGNTLINEVFKQLEDKTKHGYKIGNIYAEAVSDNGAALLCTNGFQTIKQLDNGTKVLKYAFDDFSMCNVYCFTPAKIVDSAKYGACGSVDNSFVKDLTAVAKNEFTDNISYGFNRKYLSGVDILLKSDDGSKAIGTVKGNVYATDFNGYCIVITQIKNIGYDPTYFIDAVSTNSIAVQSAQQEVQFTSLLNDFGLETVGRSKAFVSLVKQPTENYLRYLLAGEAFISDYVAATISATSNTLNVRNFAQYDFSDIYESEIATVYIMNKKYTDESSKYSYELLMIFILELLSMQISAVSANYKSVMDNLNNSSFSSESVNQINVQFSKSAQLWSADNFKYLLARQLYEKTSATLCLSKQKKQFLDALSIYEKLNGMNSQSKVESTSKITSKYFLIFSLLSGFSTINSFISLLFQLINRTENSLQAAITIITGIIGIILLTITLVLYRKSKTKNLGFKNNKNNKK